MAADTPLDCWTCAYRKTVPFYGYSPYVCVTEQHCRRFGRSDRFGNTMTFSCAEAYDTFCGGGDYKPTLLTRLVRWFS